MNECLICEFKSRANTLISCLLYRSPSQDHDQFESFKTKWEETIVNIQDCFLTISIFIGDFNARNSDWWIRDTTNAKGREIDEIASQFNLHQVID